MWPTLTVDYVHWKGEVPYQPMWGRSLTDSMGLEVDLADGNLILHASDLEIAGTGLDLSIDRYYNSQNPGTVGIGQDWLLTIGLAIRLIAYGGSVDYRAPSGADYVFILNPDGTYTSPPAVDATLVKNADGTYTLSFHNDGSRLSFSGDGSHKATSLVDQNGNTITYTYSGTSITAVTDTQGRMTSFSYGTNGLISQIIDPAGRMYTYAYDANNDLVSSTDPAGGVTSYVYDPDHTHITQITDPKGNVTSISYGPGGVRQIGFGVGTPSYVTEVFTYSSGSTAVTDANGHVTTYYFDGAGRETRVVDALGNTTLTWNPDNQITSATDSLGNTTQAGYDANNNLIREQLPTGATTTWAYADLAHPYYPTSMTDPQGNRTTYAYDAAGDLTTVTNGLTANNQTVYTYNANGTIASLTDPMGHVTTYTYDGKGNLTKITPPAPLGATSYTYDSLSRVTSRIDGLGQTTTYTYDPLDRVTSTTFQGGMSVTYTYDADGNLVSQTDPTGTTTYAYNALNQETRKTLPSGQAITYTWDGEGNLLTLTDSAGTVSYAYNAVNQVSTLTEPGGGGTTSFSYNANEQLTATNYPNGVSLTRSYDASGRLVTIAAARAGTSLTSFTYSYANPATGSDTDLRQRVTDVAGNVTTYTYDALNRLLRAQTAGPNPSDYQYTYDGAGNRLSANNNGTIKTYTYDAADEMVKVNSTTYTYDADGNQTGNSLGLSLSYNAANQNTSATPPGGQAIPMTYAGTGQRERVSADGTSFVYNLLGMDSETDSGGTTSYIRDPSGTLVDEVRPGNRYYYLFDGTGSVVGLTNASGSLAKTYTYDPYGQVVSSTGSIANHFKFQSGYQDPSTGFIKFGERYYDPGTGRWTQPDPVPMDAGDSTAQSGYLYVNDDPVDYVDPSGEMLIGGGGSPAPKNRPSPPTHVTPKPQPAPAPHPSSPSPRPVKPKPSTNPRPKASPEAGPPRSAGSGGASLGTILKDALLKVAMCLVGAKNGGDAGAVFLGYFGHPEVGWAAGAITGCFVGLRTPVTPP